MSQNLTFPVLISRFKFTPNLISFINNFCFITLSLLSKPFKRIKSTEVILYWKVNWKKCDSLTVENYQGSKLSLWFQSIILAKQYKQFVNFTSFSQNKMCLTLSSLTQRRLLLWGWEEEKGKVRKVFLLYRCHTKYRKMGSLKLEICIILSPFWNWGLDVQNQGVGTAMLSL